jgi:hypothetical protein
MTDSSHTTNLRGFLPGRCFPQHRTGGYRYVESLTPRRPSRLRHRSSTGRASVALSGPDPTGWDARAALARLEQLVETLRTRAVCEGWHPNGLDEAAATRALAYFRAGCPEESDEDFAEREAAFDFISSHGQSLDWVVGGDPLGLICRAAAHSRRAQLVLDADLLAIGTRFQKIEDEHRVQLAMDRDGTADLTDDTQWEAIHDRLSPLAAEILSKKAQTIAGLAVQTRAITLVAYDIWEPAFVGDSDHERKFIEAVCAFVRVAVPFQDEAVS